MRFPQHTYSLPHQHKHSSEVERHQYIAALNTHFFPIWKWHERKPYIDLLHRNVFDKQQWKIHSIVRIDRAEKYSPKNGFREINNNNSSNGSGSIANSLCFWAMKCIGMPKDSHNQRKTHSRRTIFVLFV